MTNGAVLYPGICDSACVWFMKADEMKSAHHGPPGKTYDHRVSGKRFTQSKIASSKLIKIK